MKTDTELILQCNPNSFIEQVIYWKGEFDPSSLQNQPLLFYLAPESLEAGKNFFDSIRLLGKAENVTLSLLLDGKQHPFQFSGAQLNHHIILMAQHVPAANSAEVTQITEEEIAAEVIQALETPESPQENSDEEDLEQREVTVWDLLEEMSRLNNELINTKRELIRKNLELERLKNQLKKG